MKNQQNGVVADTSAPVGGGDDVDEAPGESEEEEEEVVCEVCYNGDVEDDNQIVMCDGCDVAVHQTCYGGTDRSTGVSVLR